MHELQRKEFKLDADVNLEESTFTGASAGIGNRDSIDDIIHPGAFNKTIRERVGARMVKLLDQHDRFTTKSLWGVVTAAKEVPAGDTAIPKRFRKDASHLLMSDFEVSKSDPNAQVALNKLAERILDGLSIGFKPIKVEFSDLNGEPFPDDGNVDPEWEWLMGRGIRHIKELAWFETSLVIWGANKAARPDPSTVKSLAQEIALRTRHGENWCPKDMELLLKTVMHAMQVCEEAPDMLKCALDECGTHFNADMLARIAEQHGGGQGLTATSDQAILQEVIRRFDAEVSKDSDGNLTLISPRLAALDFASQAKHEDAGDGDDEKDDDAATEAAGQGEADTSSSTSDLPTQDDLKLYLARLNLNKE